MSVAITLTERGTLRNQDIILAGSVDDVQTTGEILVLTPGILAPNNLFVKKLLLWTLGGANAVVTEAQYAIAEKVSDQATAGVPDITKSHELAIAQVLPWFQEDNASALNWVAQFLFPFSIPLHRISAASGDIIFVNVPPIDTTVAGGTYYAHLVGVAIKD